MAYSEADDVNMELTDPDALQLEIERVQAELAALGGNTAMEVDSEEEEEVVVPAAAPAAAPSSSSSSSSSVRKSGRKRKSKARSVLPPADGEMTAEEIKAEMARLAVMLERQQSGPPDTTRPMVKCTECYDWRYVDELPIDEVELQCIEKFVCLTCERRRKRPRRSKYKSMRVINSVLKPHINHMDMPMVKAQISETKAQIRSLVSKSRRWAMNMEKMMDDDDSDGAQPSLRGSSGRSSSKHKRKRSPSKSKSANKKRKGSDSESSSEESDESSSEEEEDTDSDESDDGSSSDESDDESGSDTDSGSDDESGSDSDSGSGSESSSSSESDGPSAAAAAAAASAATSTGVLGAGTEDGVLHASDWVVERGGERSDKPSEDGAPGLDADDNESEATGRDLALVRIVRDVMQQLELSQNDVVAAAGLRGPDDMAAWLSGSKAISQLNHKEEMIRNWLRSINVDVADRPQPRTFHVGDLVDAKDRHGRWFKAVVEHAQRESVRVHFLEFTAEFDEEIPIGQRIAALGEKTGPKPVPQMKKKGDLSNNGAAKPKRKKDKKKRKKKSKSKKAKGKKKKGKKKRKKSKSNS